MGFLDELFGETPKGNYETKDTTTFVQSLFGERSVETRDLRTDEVGKGKGDNIRDAKSSAFHHLKDANPYDPNYTPGPKQEGTTSSTSSGGSGGGGGGASTESGIGGLVGAVIIGGIICWGIFGIFNRPDKPQTRNNHLILEKRINELPNPLKERERLQYPLKYESLVTEPQSYKNLDLEKKTCEPEISNSPPFGNDFKTPYIDIDPQIISSFNRFVKPSDLIDLHDGSIAVKLDSGSYHKVDSEKLKEMDEIYKRYLQICQNALYNKNKYKSRKTIESNVKANLKKELRRVILYCEQIETF